MNERILELILEATSPSHRSQGFGGEPTHIYPGRLDPEKFAELIVRECLGISYKESHLPNAILFDERSDKFIKDIHNRIDRATKKHFGVEE